jgi:serine protease
MRTRQRTRLPFVFMVALAFAAWPLLPRSSPPIANLPGVTLNDPAWNVAGEVVVDLRDDSSPTDILELGRNFGLSLLDSAPGGNPGRILTASVDPARLPSLLSRLRQDRRVEAAEPQRVFRLPADELIGAVQPQERTAPRDGGAKWQPNDPRYGEQWNFQRIRTEEAWPTNHGRGVTVAVIDTGVAYADGPRGKRARDFPETEFADGYDFIHKDSNPYDDHGHGTHVAGTIAETTNNNEGVAGIAFEARIMPIKVLSAEGWGRMSDIAAGIRFAADHGAKVINMSLGGPYADSITHGACKYALSKGVTIVCAAGNGGGEGVGYPAAYPECIAVSALGPKGQLAPYSSWGAQVAISAPGGDKSQGEDAGILQNTVLEGQDDYYSFQGTSMATPHVAAVAALIASEGVTSPDDVRGVLLKSAQPRGPKEKYGAGELDAAAAVRRAGAERSDYWGRVWLAGAIWGLALIFAGGTAGRQRRIGAAVAVTVGLFLPDLFSIFAGYGSLWNLLGHSALIPVFLLISEAEADKEARFYGVMALGTALHILWDLYYGTAPFIGGIPWAALPWLYANVVLGLWAWLMSRSSA